MTHPVAFHILSAATPVFHGRHVGGSWLRMKHANVTSARPNTRQGKAKGKPIQQLLSATCLERNNQRIGPLKRWYLPSFRPSDPNTKQGGTKERKGHPRSTGTTCSNIKLSKESCQPTQLKIARRSRSFSFISFTTLKRRNLGSENLLLPSRHSEHSERGEPRDFELAQHASLISWYKRSIAMWQLNATRPTSQSSRKTEITSLDQFCRTTSIARFPTMCS